MGACCFLLAFMAIPRLPHFAIQAPSAVFLPTQLAMFLEPKVAVSSVRGAVHILVMPLNKLRAVLVLIVILCIISKIKPSIQHGNRP